MTTPIDRIVEPFAKAAFATWLVQQGARHVMVSIDGNELRAAEFPKYLSEDFKFQRNPKSISTWVGTFTHHTAVIVETCCLAGIDIKATFLNGEVWAGECKGESTPNSIKKSGSDLDTVYNCLGQLLATAGKMSPLPKRKFAVLPISNRIGETMQLLASNPLLTAIGIEVALVDNYGTVKILSGTTPDEANQVMP